DEKGGARGRGAGCSPFLGKHMLRLRVYKAERGAQCEHCSRIPRTYRSPSKETRTPEHITPRPLRNCPTSRALTDPPAHTVKPSALQNPQERPKPGKPHKRTLSHPPQPGATSKPSTRNPRNQDPPEPLAHFLHGPQHPGPAEEPPK
ncbi:hypothetical protein NDU88_004179, partial [Pleurodeles waltl]